MAIPAAIMGFVTYQSSIVVFVHSRRRVSRECDQLNKNVVLASEMAEDNKLRSCGHETRPMASLSMGT